MKNGVECYKDFFPYFKALKTNCVWCNGLKAFLTVKFNCNFKRNCKYGCSEASYTYLLNLPYLPDLSYLINILYFLDLLDLLELMDLLNNPDFPELQILWPFWTSQSSSSFKPFEPFRTTLPEL